jgi:hypothetical protein
VPSREKRINPKSGDGAARDANKVRNSTDVSIFDTPGFGLLVKSLQKLVDREATSLTSYFFIARFPNNQSTDFPYIYMLWQEGKAIWILELGGTKQKHWDTVVLFPKGGTRVDFDTDVVSRDEDVGTSTYLVSRPWVNEIIYRRVMEGG